MSKQTKLDLTVTPAELGVIGMALHLRGIDLLAQIKAAEDFPDSEQLTKSGAEAKEMLPTVEALSERVKAAGARLGHEDWIAYMDLPPLSEETG